MGLSVFVGYGYNARDRWIETHVVPIIRAFGCTVEHGKAVYGGALPIEVMKRIQASDAMIGFTTRREGDSGNAGQFTTHPWVVQELTAALAQKPPLPFVEVREEGVTAPGGAIDAFNALRIDYRERDRADCLRDIALALRRFTELVGVITVRVGPEAVAERIQPYLDDPTFICRCQVLRGANEQTPELMPVLPIKGGLFLKLRGIAEGDFVRIAISAAGHRWFSNYESVDTVDIRMKSPG